MTTMILISSVAVVVALVGAIAIWGSDVRRSDSLRSDEGVRERTRPANPLPARPSPEQDRGELPHRET